MTTLSPLPERYVTVYEFINDQPWSAETARIARTIVARREDRGEPPLTFNQWLSWVRGRR